MHLTLCLMVLVATLTRVRVTFGQEQTTEKSADEVEVCQYEDKKYGNVSVSMPFLKELGKMLHLDDVQTCSSFSVSNDFHTGLQLQY